MNILARMFGIKMAKIINTATGVSYTGTYKQLLDNTKVLPSPVTSSMPYIFKVTGYKFMGKLYCET